MVAVLCLVPNVHFIPLKHTEFKEIKAENDLSVRRFVANTIRAGHVHSCSRWPSGVLAASTHPLGSVVFMSSSFCYMRTR